MVRAGYGTLDVASRHADGPFARQILSWPVWTIGWMSALAAATALAVLAGAPPPPSWSSPPSPCSRP